MIYYNDNLPPSYKEACKANTGNLLDEENDSTRKEQHNEPPGYLVTSKQHRCCLLGLHRWLEKQVRRLTGRGGDLESGREQVISGEQETEMGERRRGREDERREMLERDEEDRREERRMRREMLERDEEERREARREERKFRREMLERDEEERMRRKGDSP